MFFSIIIPLYNRPQEIDELLETLTKQTRKNFEVLVIEDGSTQKADKIVEQYQHLLDVHYFFKPNEGQGFTRNFGFSKAKGDYFVIFDSDCLIPENYLEIVEKSLNENWLDCYGGPDGAHSSFSPVQKAISYSMTSFFTTGGIRGKKKQVGQFHPRSFNMGVSRKVWEQIGGFVITKMGEDIEYSIRIHESGFKIGLIPTAVVFHKRRTSFKQFFKQIFFFGRARINIYTFYPRELKIIHFFPFVATSGLAILLLSHLLWLKVALVGDVLLLLYLLLIFADSAIKNKSMYVAFLSVIAVWAQFIAYGTGFAKEAFGLFILKRKPKP